MNQSNAFFQRIDEMEYSLCLLLNSATRRLSVRKFFAAVSRLGDGVFWYSLMVIIPVVYGLDALPQSLHLFGLGVVNLGIYKLLKLTLGRQRPYILHKDIHPGTAPLDWYSFPSGHTLHAVAFTIVLISYHTMLAWLVVPFTALVALSRVTLGLHYPSDVLAGGCIGSSTALLSLILL